MLTGFRQRGALTVTSPLLVLLVFFLTVLLLDGARLYAKKREMQAQANSAVTAAVDYIQACSLTAPDIDIINTIARTGALEQGWDGQQNFSVYVGVVESDAQGVAAFRPVSRLEESNAVAVRYVRDEPISALLPEKYFGSVQIQVSAAARKEVIATLSASPSTAVVDGALLGGILGAALGDSSFRLDATSLDSLMNTTVLLGDLLQVVGVDSVTDLLGLDADVLAGALKVVSGATGPLAEALDGIVAAAGISTVQVSDVIKVVGDFGAPENSGFPLYDAVISLALNAIELQQDGGALISLPVFIEDLNIPLIAEISGLALKVYVGRPPVVVIGPARQDSNGQWMTDFYAPDISIELDANIRLLNVDLVVATLNLADLTIPLGVHVGGGRGYLVGADCAAGTQENSVLLDVLIETSVARVVSGTVDPGTGVVSYQPINANVGTLKLLLIPLLNPALQITAGIDASIPSEVKTVELSPALRLDCDSDACQPATYESPGGGLSEVDLTLDPLEVRLLGADLGGLLAPIKELIENLLDDVVGSLANAVINPLLQALGLGLSGISVSATNAVQAPIHVLEGIDIQI